MRFRDRLEEWFWVGATLLVRGLVVLILLTVVLGVWR